MARQWLSSISFLNFTDGGLGVSSRRKIRALTVGATPRTRYKSSSINSSTPSTPLIVTKQKNGRWKKVSPSQQRQRQWTSRTDSLTDSQCNTTTSFGCRDLINNQTEVKEPTHGVDKKRKKSQTLELDFWGCLTILVVVVAEIRRPFLRRVVIPICGVRSFGSDFAEQPSGVGDENTCLCFRRLARFRSSPVCLVEARLANDVVLILARDRGFVSRRRLPTGGSSHPWWCCPRGTKPRWGLDQFVPLPNPFFPCVSQVFEWGSPFSLAKEEIVDKLLTYVVDDAPSDASEDVKMRYWNVVPLRFGW